MKLAEQTCQIIRTFVAPLIVTFLVVACGPVDPFFPTPKPPTNYFDVATLIPNTFLTAAPSLSADGRYLALGETELTGVAPHDLLVLDLEEKRILHEVNIGGVTFTSISPNGSYVAADRGNRSNRKLFVFDTGKVTAIQEITGSAPAWSSDGQLLAYGSTVELENGTWQIEVRLLEISSGQEQIIFEQKVSQAYILPLAWSPDNSMIAFNLNFPPEDALGTSNTASILYLLDLETKKANVLAENWEIRSLQFSPDSSKLLFLGARLPLERSPKYRLYVLGNEGDCHQVALPFPDTDEFAMSANGKLVAMHVENPEWLLVAPTEEVLQNAFWEVGDTCPPLLE